MNKSNNLKILKNFPGNASELVFWSFRYSLGRRTAATCDFAECLVSAWAQLNEKYRYPIQSELEEAFEQDAVARVSGERYGRLGMDCDRAAWEKVRAAYTKGGQA